MLLQIRKYFKELLIYGKIKGAPLSIMTGNGDEI